MFHKLKYVYAVYTEKSFTKAAQKLFISQPSLSAAIKKVEEEVGAALFDRSGAEVTLTEVGRAYVETAEKMLKLEEDFTHKIEDIYNLETGALSVGGTNYLSSFVLPRIIKRFSALYPKIKVSLVEGNSLALNKMVQEEKLDVIVDSFDNTMDAYEGYPLTSEKILLCVPKDRAINEELEKFRVSASEIKKGGVNFAKIPSVGIEKFAGEEFVLLKSGNDMYNRATYLFEKAGMKPNVSFSVDQLNISYALAGSGMGLCFVTDTLVRFGDEPKNVYLYNVGGEGFNRTLYIAYKKNKYCSKAMEKFIEVAKEVVQEIKIFKKVKKEGKNA